MRYADEYVTVEKERKKAEKDAKFAAKKAKLEADKNAGGAVPGDAGRKQKEKKKAEEPVEEEYFELTPPGEKKGRIQSFVSLIEMPVNPEAT